MSRQIGIRYMRCMGMRCMGMRCMGIKMLHIEHKHPGEEEAEIEAKGLEIEAKGLAVSMIAVRFSKPWFL